MKKASSGLYDIARNVGKMASKLNDMETLLSGDPEKIMRRVYNKQLFKVSNKLTKNFRIK